MEVNWKRGNSEIHVIISSRKDKNLAFKKKILWMKTIRERGGKGGGREERRGGLVTFFKCINKLSECSCSLYFAPTQPISLSHFLSLSLLLTLSLPLILSLTLSLPLTTSHFPYYFVCLSSHSFINSSRSPGGVPRKPVSPSAGKSC